MRYDPAMLAALHYMLMAWYFTGPVVALVIAIALARRSGRRVPIVSWGVTLITAGALGGGLAGIYAVAVGGEIVLGQALLATYAAAGMLFLLKGLDYLLRYLTGPKADADPRSRFSFRAQIGFIVRVVLLFGIGLPYVMAAVMTYRPKVGLSQTPTTDYEVVTFPSADGTRLSGWWIGLVGIVTTSTDPNACS